MELVETQWEFAKNVKRLISFIEAEGFVATVGEAYRPYELHLLYLHGATVENSEFEDFGLRIVQGKQKAYTKTSKHLKRLAIDFNFFRKNDNDEYSIIYDADILHNIGAFWEGLNQNNVWGGFWKNPDITHFQTSY